VTFAEVGFVVRWDCVMASGIVVAFTIIWSMVVLAKVSLVWCNPLLTLVISVVWVFNMLSSMKSGIVLSIPLSSSSIVKSVLSLV